MRSEQKFAKPEGFRPVWEEQSRRSLQGSRFRQSSDSRVRDRPAELAGILAVTGVSMESPKAIPWLRSGVFVYALISVYLFFRVEISRRN